MRNCNVLTYLSWYCLGRGGCAGFGGVHFWHHKETLTFKVPTTKQATAICLIGENKPSSEFDTLFVTSLLVVEQFNGLSAQCFVDISVAKV